jgi:hypothetical protein
VALRTKFNQSRYASYAPLLWRVLAFIGIFVIVSGILGPRVISGGILYKDHFGIYGGIGKALLFGAIAFLLLASRDKNRLQLLAWQRANLVWLLLAALSTAYAWIGISHLLAGNSVHSRIIVCSWWLLWAGEPKTRRKDIQTGTAVRATARGSLLWILGAGLRSLESSSL